MIFPGPQKPSSKESKIQGNQGLPQHNNRFCQPHQTLKTLETLELSTKFANTLKQFSTQFVLVLRSCKLPTYLALPEKTADQCASFLPHKSNYQSHSHWQIRLPAELRASLFLLLSTQNLSTTELLVGDFL